MATQKQKIAVKAISENLGNPSKDFSLGKVMLKAGYSEITSKTPANLINSQGFRELCNEAGLTENLLLKAIADDIRDKPRDRSKELAIGCKVLGLYKADNEQKTTPLDIPDVDFIEIIRSYKVRK